MAETESDKCIFQYFTNSANLYYAIEFRELKSDFLCRLSFFHHD